MFALAMLASALVALADFVPLNIGHSLPNQAGPVSIHAKLAAGEGDFLLDTGASASTLAELYLVNEMMAGNAEPVTDGKGGLALIHMCYADGRCVNVNAFIIHDVEIGACTLHDIEFVPGDPMLGLNALAKFKDWRINMADHRFEYTCAS
jgi:hypothetical protein